jgi:hypothetical protein
MYYSDVLLRLLNFIKFLELTACRQFKECLAGVEQFGKYVIDFEYFLIDVNRYSAKELLGFRNLIGGVFFLDQKKDKDELLRQLAELIGTLEKLEPDFYRLFAVWLKNIAVLGFHIISEIPMKRDKQLFIPVLITGIAF